MIDLRKVAASGVLLLCLTAPGTVSGREPSEGSLRNAPHPSIRSRGISTLSMEGPGRLRLSWVFDASSLRVEVTEGGQTLRASGYGVRPAGGGLLLPFKVEYVAIPEGVSPRLEISSQAPSRAVPLDTLPHRSTPAPASALSFYGAPPSKAAGAASAASPVTLGRVGYFRDQRFVEVRVSPARLAGDGRSLEVFENLSASLIWDAAAERGGAQAPEDPRAERTYQRLFLNYEEARRWRMRSSRTASGASIAATSLDAAVTAASSSEGTAVPPRVRVLVDQDRLVRITQPLLNSVAPEMAAADPRALRLLYRGSELPIRVAGEADGRLDPVDFIEFFGTQRVEPPTVTRSIDPFFPTFALNDFTDVNVYWLEGGATAPLRVRSLSAAPSGNLLPEPHWRSTARSDPPDLFRPFGSNDPWAACPRVSDSAASCSGSMCCQSPDHDFTLPLLDYASVEGDGALRLLLQGWTATPHVVELALNGSRLGTEPLEWVGPKAVPSSFIVPNRTLGSSPVVNVALPGNGTNQADSVMVDSIEVDYRRLFRAVSGSLDFRFEDREALFAIEGFSNSSLVAYDLSELDPSTGHPRGRLLTDIRVETTGGAFRAVLQQASEGGSGRRLLVAGTEAVVAPAGVARVQPQALCDPAQGADLIVIGHASLIDLSPGSPLEKYVAHRVARGLRVRVVDVQDVYDQFAWGFPEPQAIKDFLACAYTVGAAPPPIYVLLLGDGTSDYKNLRRLSDHQNLVVAPVHTTENTVFGYYSADEWLAAFRGEDALADVLIGRLSAGNAEEAGRALEKIVRYEAGGGSDPWRAHGLFVAGDGNSTEEDTAFLRASTDAAAHFLAPFTTRVMMYDGTQTASFRNSLQSAINEGAALVNYVGHGNVTIWDGDQIFRNADVADLTNIDRLPLFVSSTCLMGAYHNDQVDSLGEVLVHSTPDTGGIATLSASGLSNFNIDEQINQTLYEAMSGPMKVRVLGEVVQAAQVALAEMGSWIDLENLTLIGDPALRLTLPAPLPPGGVTAAAGNARVDIAWEASPDPVAGYHIYRSGASDPAVDRGATYLRLTSTPVNARSFTDTQVVNTRLYAYAVTAVDPEGFEGAFSNRNSTCGVSATDCVRAAPHNPVPPAAPTGLTAVDPGAGYRIDLSWNPNSEPDLKEYTVYYGTLQGDYPHQVSTGLKTSASINGLSNDVTYYFAVTATNTSDGFTPPGATEPLNTESVFSGAVSAVPHLIQGIRPPARIRDLRAVVEPDLRSLRLLWSRPTLDIYGSPIVVAAFQVHRGLSVGFRPAQDTLVARLSADSTSWVDVDALVDQRSSYYFVLAEDGSGLLSSASRAHPTGVTDLRISQVLDALTGAPNGNLTLAWGAVTRDIEGLPTVVDHYELYASPSPFGRGSLSSATLVAGDIRAYTLTLQEPTGRRYYFLVAVDRRGNLSPF